LNDLLKKLYDAVLDGQRDAAKENVESALGAGLNPADVLDAMVSAMGENTSSLKC